MAMTIREFNKKLDDQLDKISDAKFLLTCVSEVHSRQVKRIFDQGLNGSGGRIGQYNSTKPLYVDPDTSPKGFPLKGKGGSDTFKSGKKHKTGYFDSYKAFRQVINKQTSFVDLWLKGDLRFDFTNSLTLTGSSYQTGTKRTENSGKVEGAIKKYGEDTFRLMQSERDLYILCVKQKVFDTLNN